MSSPIGWITRSVVAAVVVASSVAIAPSAGAREPVHDACNAGYQAVAGAVRSVGRVGVNPGPPEAPRDIQRLTQAVGSTLERLQDVAHPPNPC